MTLSYNVTGPERKKLVGAISEIINAPAKYLGPPGFAYEVGDYHIDKTGTVTGPDNRELADALAEPHGFVSLIGEYDEDAGTEPPAADGEPMSLFNSAEQPEAETAEPEAETAEPEPAVEPEPEDGHQAADVAQEAEAAPEPSDEPQEPETPQEGEPAAPEAEEGEPVELVDGVLTIEVPLSGFTVEALDNLRKMVLAKSALLKDAIGAETLPLIRNAETIEFPWFPADSDAEHVQAYTVLASQLCKTAKEKKRVNAKAKDTEGSPKYAMRCFLLSLGMIGPEFKEARRVLLSRLTGNSSFCSQASEDRWKAKHTGGKGDAVSE